MRARAHIPLTQNPVFFFSMRARSLSTQFSPYQVSTWRPETALPPTAASQPVLSSWPQPASLRISLLLSSNHIDPLSTSPRIICSGLRSLPQGLCTCSFFFLNPKPSFPTSWQVWHFSHWSGVNLKVLHSEDFESENHPRTEKVQLRL